MVNQLILPFVKEEKVGRLIVKVDSLVLLFFTKISNKIYRLTGLTKFFLAKLALCFATISLTTTIVGFWFPILGYKPSVVVVVWSAILVIGLLLETNLCDKAQDNMFSYNRINFFSKFCYSQTFRFLWIILTIGETLELLELLELNASSQDKGILIFKILHNSFALSIGSFNYLIAVDPPSPGKSKIRIWAEAFSASFHKLIQIKVET